MITVQDEMMSVATSLLLGEWEVIDLPLAKKSPPPVGATGKRGVALSEEALMTALESGTRQLGIRLPPNVIGIDIDGYKDDFRSILNLNERLGSLPSTFGITSHGSYRSQTLLFLVPDGYHAVESAASAIDIIQHTHRYCVAPPSIHPSGSKYTWTRDGAPTSIIPEVSMLTELPQEWVNFLRTQNTHSESVGTLELDSSDDMCPILRAVLKKGVEGFSNRGRHDALVAASYAVASTAAKGHRGSQKAMTTLLDHFASQTLLEGREQEAARVVESALEAAGERSGRLCTCGQKSQYRNKTRSRWLISKA